MLRQPALLLQRGALTHRMFQRPLLHRVLAFGLPQLLLCVARPLLGALGQALGDASAVGSSGISATWPLLAALGQALGDAKVVGASGISATWGS